MKYTMDRMFRVLLAALSIVILYNPVFARGGGGHSGGSHSGVSYTGSRGGVYHFSSNGSGNKVYESRSSNYGAVYSYSGGGEHNNSNYYDGNLTHEVYQFNYKTERSKNRSIDSIKSAICEYKSVMADDDYRACGVNPPPYQ